MKKTPNDVAVPEAQALAEQANRLSAACSLRPFTPEEAEEAVDVLLAIPGLLSVVATLQQERDERLTRESGLALIEEAQRWQRAYDERCRELVAVREDVTRLREALSEMRTWAGALEATLGSAKRAKAKAIGELADAALVVSSPPPGAPLTEPEAHTASTLPASGSVSVSPPPGERAAPHDDDFNPSPTAHLQGFGEASTAPGVPDGSPETE